MRDSQTDALKSGITRQASNSQSETASAIAGQVQEKAQAAAGQAKSFIRKQIEQRATDAGGKIEETAKDIRSVGSELRERGYETAGSLAEQIASRAERVGGYLRDSDSDRMLADMEDFASRQPWLVAAGGLLLGLAASRVIKASRSRRYRGSARGEYEASPEHPSGHDYDRHGSASYPERGLAREAHGSPSGLYGAAAQERYSE